VCPATSLAHTAALNAVSPGLLPYLDFAGRPLAVAVAAYYAIKAVIFLLAAIVAICTKDEKRRSACIEIVRAVCRGWPWPSRLSGLQHQSAGGDGALGSGGTWGAIVCEGFKDTAR
jgi:hypothetical protein